MDQTEVGSFAFTGHEDRFQYFVAIALPALCAAVAIALVDTRTAAVKQLARA